MTTVSDDTQLKGLITNVIVAAATKAPEPPPKRFEDDYRFYHCYEDWSALKCTKVESPSVSPTRENTKLLFVKKFIPERFDSKILKYKWLPNEVKIENKST